jgi:hypothetical protein
VKAVKEAVTSTPGKIAAGAAVAGGVSALAATGKPLPVQPPKIPIGQGVTAELTYEGPVNAPTYVGVTVTLEEQAAKGKKTPPSDPFAADIARVKAQQEMFKPEEGKPAEKQQQADELVQAWVTSRAGLVVLPSVTIPLKGTPKGEQKPKEEAKKEEEKAPVQRAQASSAAPQPAGASVDEAISSPGRPIEPAARRTMEARFGYDFSRVRVHDDVRAAATARGIDAAAFTVGEDIAFGTSRYDPSTSDGRRLLAHELAHVVQQSDAKPSARPGFGLGPLRFGHDLSRIPIRHHAIGQPPPTWSSSEASSPEDPGEREADAVADRVMSMVAPTPPPLVAAARADHGTGGEEKVQLLRRKANAAMRPKATSATGIALDAAAKGGTPLTTELRAYFEPRFGHDMSHVRVHVSGGAAEGARAAEARAYTVGSDIVFSAGEYAPSTNEGKRLLAHELAHVVQHEASPSRIRRQIKTDPRASLSGFFTSKRIKNVTESNGVYGLASSVVKGTAEQEILIDMLVSPRVFHLDGDSDATVASNLNGHVKARTGIVNFATQKKYGFASRSGWSMNPQYYDWDPNRGERGWWGTKPNVDEQAAWDDLNVNPHLYAIGCAAATRLTMRGGSRGDNIIDKPSSDSADWVPGDAGYIENTNFQAGSDIGVLGENIIYTGNDMFWGHVPGSVTYRTLNDWTAFVQRWNGGAKLDSKRELPATGLLDT